MEMMKPLLLMGAVSALSLLSGLCLHAEGPNGVPAGEQSLIVKTKYDDAFGSLVEAARTNTDRNKVLNSLLTQNNLAPELRYFLLLDILELAKETKRFPEAKDVFIEFIDKYAMSEDALSELAESVGDSIPSSINRTVYFDYVDGMKELAIRCLGRNHFASGEVLLADLLRLTKKSRDRELVSKYQQALKMAQELVSEQEDYLESLQLIEKDSQNSEAQEKIGIYYGFIVGDWKKALPYLKSSTHSGLKELVEIESGEKKLSDQETLSLSNQWIELSQERRSNHMYASRGAQLLRELEDSQNSLVRGSASSRLQELSLKQIPLYALKQRLLKELGVEDIDNTIHAMSTVKGLATRSSSVDLSLAIKEASLIAQGEQCVLNIVMRTKFPELSEFPDGVRMGFYMQLDDDSTSATGLPFSGMGADRRFNFRITNTGSTVTIDKLDKPASGSRVPKILTIKTLSDSEFNYKIQSDVIRIQFPLKDLGTGNKKWNLFLSRYSQVSNVTSKSGPTTTVGTITIPE